MKPDNAFVITMLAMFSVTTPDEIRRDQITGDHVRLMDQSLTPETKELLLELSSEADEKTEPVMITIDDDRFVDCGILAASQEEIILICRIYGSQGREIEITEDGLVVSPHERVLSKRRQIMRKGQLV